MIRETNYILKIVTRGKTVIDILGYLKLRRKIKPMDDEWVFVCPAHSGDTYILCRLSQAFIQKYGGSFSVVTPYAYSSIPRLFPSISKILVYEKFPSLAIGKFFMDFITEDNKDGIRQRPIWGFPNELLVPTAGYKDIRFIDSFKMFLGLDPEAKLIEPTISDELRDRAAKKFQGYNLPIGKTVIFAPYAKSTPTLSEENWVTIVEKLRMAGLYPVTNIGKNEAPLPGTTGIMVPFDEVLPFSELAGHVVSIRSGLCDVLSTSKSKLTIIYTQHRFGRTSFYDYTSLRLNGLVGEKTELQELIYDSDENCTNIIEQTINFHVKN